MANRVIEKAMHDRQLAARAAALRADPKATKITVSIAHGRVTVDYMDGKGEPQRFLHTEADDVLAAEQAEASSRIKHVKQGELK